MYMIECLLSWIYLYKLIISVLLPGGFTYWINGLKPSLNTRDCGKNDNASLNHTQRRRTRTSSFFCPSLSRQFNMSSLNDQQINDLMNGTLSSYIDVNTTIAVLNATIDSYADTTNLDNSADDVFNRLDSPNNSTVDGLSKRDHVFDRTDVRVIFTITYSLVFCCCFFGEYIFSKIGN